MTKIIYQSRVNVCQRRANLALMWSTTPVGHTAWYTKHSIRSLRFGHFTPNRPSPETSARKANKMTINSFQAEEIFNAFRKNWGAAAILDWEITSFITKLECILEFAPDSQEQADAFKAAREFEFVLESFYTTNRKVMAIKFVRQISDPTPGLRDAKVVVDHFWDKFRAEGVVQFDPTAISPVSDSNED